MSEQQRAADRDRRVAAHERDERAARDAARHRLAVSVVAAVVIVIP